MSNSYTYTTNTSNVSLNAVANLYESVGFGVADFYKNDTDLLNAIFGPGVYGFFSFGNSEQGLVGMARVLSDDRICSWIAELCIHPESQDKEVEGELLTMVTKRFSHTAIYTEALVGTEELFAKYQITHKKKLLACSRAPQLTLNISDGAFVH